MLKSITIAAIAGSLSLVAVPALNSVAFAQAAAGPEPMKGAQPMDSGAGSMEKGGDSASMEKGSMKKGHMKHSKHMAKHKKSM